MNTTTDLLAQPITKPNGVSAAMWRKFIEDFGRGCDLWTSEDGSMTGLAVVRVEDAPTILANEFGHFLRREKPITLDRLKARFAYREWAGADFFDGNSRSPARGKVWRIGDDPTPFPVFEYEMEFPH